MAVTRAAPLPLCQLSVPRAPREAKSGAETESGSGTTALLREHGTDGKAADASTEEYFAAKGRPGRISLALASKGRSAREERRKERAISGEDGSKGPFRAERCP
ncbi:hypothetical protein KM043_004837 [Ampulex compressa]|nr:hypothetical protein KM043_004837 [Ampulex compressa]